MLDLSQGSARGLSSTRIDGQRGYGSRSLTNSLTYSSMTTTNRSGIGRRLLPATPGS